VSGGGKASLSARFAASLGPALVTTMVYVTSVPATSAVDDLVTETSALCVRVVVAEAMCVFGSDDAEMSALLVSVCAGAGGAVCPWTVTVPLVPNCTIEQLTVPLLFSGGVVHVQPGAVTESKRTAAGSTSFSTASAASLGPALVTLRVYVIGAPAAAEGGAVLLIVSNDCQITSAVSVTLLSFGSGSGEVVVTFAVSVIGVPCAVARGTFTTSVKTSEPGANVGVEQLIAPVPPLDGAAQLQLPGNENEFSVVPAGTLVERSTFNAFAGPSLLTVMVYVAVVPATGGLPPLMDASTDSETFCADASVARPATNESAAMSFLGTGTS